MPQFADHKLHWEPDQEGKGFIIRPTPHGIKHWPELANADPVIWTWPTAGMKPTHSQMGTKTVFEIPQGMAPDRTSHFHIQPDGGVYQFGSGRTLNDADYQAINDADSNLTPVGSQPESEDYGHANRLLEVLGKWRRIPRLWRESRQVTSGGDWFVPSYGIPNDAKEQIQAFAQSLPWDEAAKLQDPSKYHITAFYSQNGFEDPSNHDWVAQESGPQYPVRTHSLDTFTGHDPGLQPVVMRFHAPELSAHAERMMDEGERRGLPVARFDGGHKPHITLGHNPQGFEIAAPDVQFMTEPLHELHSYYDSLKH